MENTVVEKSQFILPNDTGVVLLDCKTAFEGLTQKERHYAYHLSQASWYGGLIVLIQTSPEAPGVFLLLQKLFRAQTPSELEVIAKALGISEGEYQALLIYAAGFYANMGNYKSFGDTKFIPDIPQDKFEALLKASAAYKADPEHIMKLWDAVGVPMFELNERNKQLGLGKKGITTYFSSNCVMHDADYSQEFLTSKDLSAYNTRLFKKVDHATGRKTYEVKLASAETSSEQISGYRDVPELGKYEFTPKAHDAKGITYHVEVTRGDYSSILKKVVENFKAAKEYAANEAQSKMLEYYIESFTTGSIPAHKDGSRWWIKDKGPIVENYIGFIESYRDPYGTRGEFEGFVAVVNKEMSVKFTDLVNDAEHLLPLLPWPSSYEKDTFQRPDFTSLDVVTFGGSGIPAGINIPNYDDIRQEEGFKNVSLGNVLSAGYKDTKITFLEEEDKVLYADLKAASFEVQVGLHELLGHGSGKQFKKETDGQFNFDTENVRHTETGEKITSWYEAKETYDSKFPVISSSYEECRAECVGLYLCLSSEVLRIFSHTGSKADDIIYINWLNMVRAGLLALEFYTPENMKWRQAHMQARYVILQVLLEAGDGLVTVKKVIGEDEQPDLIIKLDRSKINSVGKPAIGKFLTKLQVYKATADYDSAKKMYDHYSEVHDDSEPHFLTLRAIVLKRKQPRKMFVQTNMVVSGDGDITLKEYDSSASGLIQSFIDRFCSPEVDNTLEELWVAERPHHTPRRRLESTQ
ncbi:dipeptidyl peptidase 3-like isoform X2 [Lineus longissimus]